MATNIDPDILATLTDEEREAIEEGMTDSEKEALAALAAEDGDDDDDDENNDDGSESSQNAAPIEGKGADIGDGDGKSNAADDAKSADAGKAADADGGDEEVGKQEFKPKYEAPLPEDFDAQVKAVQDEGRELAKQFKDGDIDFDEFEAKREELDARRDALRDLKVKADIASDMTQQSAQQEWAFTVKSFVRQVAKAEGIDYAKDESKRNDLDIFVKALGSDDNNADKDMQWFLDEAHKRVKALHGIGKQEPTKDLKKDAEKTVRKTPIDSAPKTLAQVPGSDGPGDVGDEFADLDGLDGEALEAAIKRMTPAQREKFAMGA